jgi:hypothetical protein
VDSPFGVDVGGVNPQLMQMMPDAAFDSWLTIGMTEGDNTGAMSSIGVPFTAWTEDSPLR